MRPSDDGPREFYGVDIDQQELRSACINCAPLPSDYLNKRKYSFGVTLYHGSVLEPEESLRDKDALVCIEVYVYMWLKYEK